MRLKWTACRCLEISENADDPSQEATSLRRANLAVRGCVEVLGKPFESSTLNFDAVRMWESAGSDEMSSSREGAKYDQLRWMGAPRYGMVEVCAEQVVLSEKLKDTSRRKQSDWRKVKLLSAEACEGSASSLRIWSSSCDFLLV